MDETVRITKVSIYPPKDEDGPKCSNVAVARKCSKHEPPTLLLGNQGQYSIHSGHSLLPAGRCQGNVQAKREFNRGRTWRCDSRATPQTGCDPLPEHVNAHLIRSSLGKLNNARVEQ